MEYSPVRKRQTAPISVARNTGTPAIDAMTAAGQYARARNGVTRWIGKSLGSGSKTIRPVNFRSKWQAVGTAHQQKRIAGLEFERRDIGAVAALLAQQGDGGEAVGFAKLEFAQRPAGKTRLGRDHGLYQHHAFEILRIVIAPDLDSRDLADALFAADREQQVVVVARRRRSPARIWHPHRARWLRPRRRVDARSRCFERPPREHRALGHAKFP